MGWTIGPVDHFTIQLSESSERVHFLDTLDHSTIEPLLSCERVEAWRVARPGMG